MSMLKIRQVKLSLFWSSFGNGHLIHLEAKLNEGTAPTDEDKQLLTDTFNKFKETMFAK